ncbi:MAG: penicillin-binding protein activator LpoB [Elusimicrobiales bacterium]
MKTVLMLAAALALTGCASSHYNTLKFRPEPKAAIAVLPLENYTESAMAGIKTASIAAGILSARGVAVADRFSGAQERAYGEQEFRKALADLAAANVSYTLSGSVNEWKYKAGLDGEPAVSVTLRLFDNKTGALVWTSVASRTGRPSQSTAVLAQKLLDKALGELE